MGESINNTLIMVRNIEDNLNETTNKLVEFKNSGVYSLLQTAISFNTDELASFISAPVAITTEDLYPITNYGSAMSPFYSVLSIWVGALILVAIIHVKVHPFDGIKVNSVEAFFNIFPYRTGTGITDYTWGFIFYRNTMYTSIQILVCSCIYFICIYYDNLFPYCSI